MTTKDGYKLRRDAYKQQVQHNNELLYCFFGKPAEDITAIQTRLNEKLKAREVNAMTTEITEINDMGLTRLGGDR